MGQALSYVEIVGRSLSLFAAFEKILHSSIDIIASQPYCFIGQFLADAKKWLNDHAGMLSACENGLQVGFGLQVHREQFTEIQLDDGPCFVPEINPSFKHLGCFGMQIRASNCAAKSLGELTIELKLDEYGLELLEINPYLYVHGDLLEWFRKQLLIVSFTVAKPVEKLMLDLFQQHDSDPEEPIFICNIFDPIHRTSSSNINHQIQDHVNRSIQHKQSIREC